MSIFRLFLFMLGVLGSVFQWGCSERCTRTCNVGERRCSVDGALLCTRDSESLCPVWAVLPCRTGQRCAAQNGVYTCTSTQPTPEECKKNPFGQKRCVGSDVYWFDACGQKRSFWMRCSAQTQCTTGECRNKSGGTECQPSKTTCQEGSQRCQGAGFQVCVLDAQKKCTKWGSIQTCSTGEQCQQGMCKKDTRTCTDQCSVGATQCSGASIQYCIVGPQKCRIWSGATKCPSKEVCRSNRCQAEGTCQDLCQDGQKRCKGSRVQTCQRMSSGCLDWGPELPCPATLQCHNGICSSGQGCKDECTEGTKRCSGEHVQTCVKETTCTKWKTASTCSTNQTCSVSSGQPLCICKPGFKVGAGGACVPNTSTPLNCGMNAEEKRTHEIVNEERQKQGLPPYKCHAALVREARKWSDKQCARGRIGHDGVGSRYKATGLSYTRAGENVAAGQPTPAAVMSSWMKSSGHRANIMHRSFTHLGVGYYNCGKGYRHFWTQLFMTIP